MTSTEPENEPTDTPVLQETEAPVEEPNISEPISESLDPSSVDAEGAQSTSGTTSEVLVQEEQKEEEDSSTLVVPEMNATDINVTEFHAETNEDMVVGGPSHLDSVTMQDDVVKEDMQVQPQVSLDVTVDEIDSIVGPSPKRIRLSNDVIVPESNEQINQSSSSTELEVSSAGEVVNEEELKMKAEEIPNTTNVSSPGKHHMVTRHQVAASTPPTPNIVSSPAALVVQSAPQSILQDQELHNVGAVSASDALPLYTESDGTLPPGWVVEERNSGDNAKRQCVYRYWYSPRSKTQLRSRVEVKKFLDLLERYEGDEELVKNTFFPQAVQLVQQQPRLPLYTQTDGSLPHGWIVEERSSGNNAKRQCVYRYWYSPVTKTQLRSRVEVKKFIEGLAMFNGDEEMVKKHCFPQALQQQPRVPLYTEDDGSLPPGWIVEEKISHNAKQQRKYRYWYTPITKTQLRSRVEVKKFLEGLQMYSGDEESAKKYCFSSQESTQRQTPRKRPSDPLPLYTEDDGSLPEGWTVQERTSGNNAKKKCIYRYWYTPSTKTQLRSRIEVKKFLEAMEMFNNDEEAAKKHCFPKKAIQTPQQISADLPLYNQDDGSLPPGWIVKEKHTSDNAKQQRIHRYWYSPITKTQLRSRVEVKRFLDGMEEFNGNEEMVKKEYFSRRRRSGGSDKIVAGNGQQIITTGGQQQHQQQEQQQQQHQEQVQQVAAIQDAVVQDAVVQDTSVQDTSVEITAEESIEMVEL